MPSNSPHRQSLIPMICWPAQSVLMMMPSSRVGRIIVVTHEHRLAARPHALGAADDERRRSVQRETARGDLVAPSELDQPLVRLDELGHVLM